MTVDMRTRLHKDVRALSTEEVFDAVVPDALAVHADLAGRGAEYKQLPALGLLAGGVGVTLLEENGTLTLRPGVDAAGVIAELAADALSDLVQDVQSTMGLAMTSRVTVTTGTLTNWIAWEPVLRALLDGRKVHEAGDVTFTGLDGAELDLDRTFTLDDDPEEVGHFLTQAGFLHLRGVFDPAEMAAVDADLDECLARATPEDGESWWAQDSSGASLPVRILYFPERSPAVRTLASDHRFRWIESLTGDGHAHAGGGDGLIKPLGIVRGLSDLPWHKDCGQGKHGYICNGLTLGISVTGADRRSGALGVIPGSHRANTMAAGRDPALDLRPRMIETVTGDVTVHCSDTLHRAHPPVERPRKVVYASLDLPLLPGDVARPDPRYGRQARAELTSVLDRIDATDRPT
jgi:hypothetical protein